jgi:thiopurine S-methyltransferase
MEKQFWLQKWQNNEIGFHEPKANPLLVNNFKALALAPDSCLFVPLCGKSHDIGWLLSQGHRVVGAELSDLAIQQLFAALGVEPTITAVGKHQHFSAPDIDIFVGDIF